MDQVDSLLKRPRAYENIDGVGELNIGFMCLSFALLMWLQVHTPEHSIWNRMYMLFIWVGLMLLASYFGSKAFKKHITYPRTGFVKYRTPDSKWPLIAVMVLASVVATVAAAGAVLAARLHWNMVPALPFGLLIAASYAFGFARTVRWKWAVAASILLGSLAIAALPPELTGTLAHGSWATAMFRAESIGSYLLCALLYGAIFLISGGITFWLYLRHTQAPAEEANEPANADVQ
ncbi:MAG: hypothetical protein ABR898_06645 [Terracidiphilus sp.]